MLCQIGKSKFRPNQNISQMCEKIMDKKTHLHFNGCLKMSKTGNTMSSRKRHVVLVAPRARHACAVATATATATAPVA